MDQNKLNELREYYDNTDTSSEMDDAELDNEVVHAPMVGITVRLPSSLLQEVREIASRENLKTTALIRRWVEQEVNATSQSGPPAFAFMDAGSVVDFFECTAVNIDSTGFLPAVGGGFPDFFGARSRRMVGA